MIIYLASDHAGFELKNKIKAFLEQKGNQTEDCGAFSFDPTDDYPDFIKKAAEAVSKNPEDRAIIFGGSGEGEAMVANRYPNVRAAVFYGPVMPQQPIDAQGHESRDPYELVLLSRKHNDSNILSIGARFVKEEEALKAVELWLITPFSNKPAHERRNKEF